MSREVARVIEALTASTLSLQRSLTDLSDDEVGRPSLLPGWTRGHVITHIARNADGMVNLATWARTGVETPMYQSREHRAADIEAGARRSAADLRNDVAASAQRLSAAFAALDGDQWQTQVRWGKDGGLVPAEDLPRLRRVEVEVHHVDLDLDYTLAHLPGAFVLEMLQDVATDLSRRDDLAGFVLVGNDNEGRWTVGAGGPEVTGTPPSLLGWLLGRTEGIGVFSVDTLPLLGPWR